MLTNRFVNRKELIGIAVLAVFLVVIMGSTDKRGVPAGFAPIAIGLALTLIHLISIPVTNTSVNPARSTGPALILSLFGGGGWALQQLWLFWLAPIVGGVIGAALYLGIAGDHDPKLP